MIAASDVDTDRAPCEAEEDYKRLLIQVLLHTMEDYTKLQHPKTRRRKYLDEAFRDAVDFLFDPTYSLAHLKDDEDRELTPLALVQKVMNGRHVTLEKIQQKVIQDAQSYWEHQELKTIEIPENVIVKGQVYTVLHMEGQGYKVNFDQKTIGLNRKDPGAQRWFVHALFQIANTHIADGDEIYKHYTMSDLFFDILRMNDCFTGNK